MEKAIKKSIEGGYIPLFTNDIESEIAIYGYNNFLLDAEFWQALGRARGWENPATFEIGYGTKIRWRYELHRFLDAIIEGKTPDQFFDSLISGTTLVE